MSLLRSLMLSLALASAISLPVRAQYDNDNPAEASGAAQLGVRIAQLEEQVRRMEGAIEQLSYENKQLKAQMEKSAGDTQYRLQALESRQAAPTAPAAGTPPAEAGEAIQPVPVTGEARDPNEAAPAAAASAQHFASSRDHYNYAFHLMNQAKYAEAGDSFAAFTRQYPHDPLVGNAFYWLGETYYVRKDYTQAADDFRQGYEAMPTGPKGADNLLKLAMSLEALKKDKEACIVLKQVAGKYDGAGSIKSRAEQEINRMGCN